MVRLGGRDHYCGPWPDPRGGPSAEAQAQYHRVLAEWLAGRLAGDDPADGSQTIAELSVGYILHVSRYYVRNGRPTKEQSVHRAAVKRLLVSYAECPVREFGPLRLRAVREQILQVKPPLARSTVNRYIDAIRAMFKWGAGHEQAPAEIHAALMTVERLHKGRGGRERQRVRPVEWERVEAVRPHVLDEVWAMIQLQWHSGMRPGEAVAMRAGDVHRDGAVWRYVVRSEVDKMDLVKDDPQERPRVVYLGRQAQAILKPFIEAAPNEDAYLFQPSAAVARWRAAQVQARQARGGVGSHKRPCRRPRRPAGECYSVPSYRRAITRACKLAGVEPWHPNQIRHSFSTRARSVLRGKGGRNAASSESALTTIAAALGHSDIEVTKVYAELQQQWAADLARRMG